MPSTVLKAVEVVVVEIEAACCLAVVGTAAVKTCAAKFVVAAAVAVEIALVAETAALAVSVEDSEKMPVIVADAQVEEAQERSECPPLALEVVSVSAVVGTDFSEALAVSWVAVDAEISAWLVVATFAVAAAAAASFAPAAWVVKTVLAALTAVSALVEVDWALVLVKARTWCSCQDQEEQTA